MKALTRRDILRGIGIGSAALVVPGAGRLLRAADAKPSADVVTLTLYNTGDMHDHSGNLARIAGFVKAQKKKDPNTLFVDAGDFANKGEREMAAAAGEGMIHLMSQCGYDACTLGNHDYIYGKGRILDLANKYPAYPLALCNVKWEDEDKKKAQVIPRYRIFDLQGVRVCIAGGSCQYFNHAHGKRLKLIHEREGYFEIYPQIAKKADVFVYISHLWDAYDRRMIGKWQDKSPDVLIGGHTHERKIWKQGPKTLIVKAGFWGRWLGKTTLQYDTKAKKVVGTSARILGVAESWPADKEVAELRQWYLSGRKTKAAVYPVEPVMVPM